MKNNKELLKLKEKISFMKNFPMAEVCEERSKYFKKVIMR